MHALLSGQVTHTQLTGGEKLMCISSELTQGNCLEGASKPRSHLVLWLPQDAELWGVIETFSELRTTLLCFTGETYGVTKLAEWTACLEFWTLDILTELTNAYGDSNLLRDHGLLSDVWAMVWGGRFLSLLEKSLRMFPVMGAEPTASPWAPVGKPQRGKNSWSNGSFRDIFGPAWWMIWMTSFFFNWFLPSPLPWTLYAKILVDSFV